MAAGAERAARRWVITGQVQGVGFRPLVCRLARELGLGGRVWNDAQGVVVEAEGPAAALTEWERRLRREAQAPARIESLAASTMAAVGANEFTIALSDVGPGTATGTVPAWVSPDLATCQACLAELHDPADRRHGYPFINCTRCGPRYTIIGGLPYDRPRTTMAAFTMCADCQREYEDAADRRFHAQPNACPRCGPRLTLWANGRSWGGAEALDQARQRLAAGAILAVKGLGGFHLACDAGDGAAVARLRQAKRRPAKPLAVMVLDLSTAGELGILSATEAALLASPRRPIVLLQRRAATGDPSGPGAEGNRAGDAAPPRVAAGVAPGQTTIGVFLPYTPLHHLLLAPPAPRALVLTSGNRGEEPLAIEDAVAEGWLAEPEPRLADAVLGHDRRIRCRADDSVLRVVGDAARMIRRGRGYTPEPLELGQSGAPVLGLGAEHKNAFCLTLDHFAILGPHVGDWDRYETEAAYAAALDNLLGLWGVQAQAVGFDPHPGYAVSAWGRRRFAAVPRYAVQHHHAHIVAVLAEHRRPGPVIGLALDGTGWGPDGAVWGGEVLCADLAGYRRWAHLRYLPLPGGEAAIREPWRVALGALREAVGEAAARAFPLPGVDPACRRGVEQLLARSTLMPRTSSGGRLFDAVAVLAGLGTRAEYEGQLAIALEAAATSDCRTDAYPIEIDVTHEIPWGLDTRPLIRAVHADLRRGVAVGAIAAGFHAALAQALEVVCRAVRARTGIGTVALGGGVWQNARLFGQLTEQLGDAGFEVLAPAAAPANDGGLGLGQAVAARARLAAGAAA
ncbi:MAG: carbamoyltransferase HypF [Terriglobales bacterium]